MKLFRFLFFFTGAALLFTARLTGRREFFLLFFVMLFVAVYALILNVWTVLSFSYVQELKEGAAVKGSSTELALGIYNDKPFPLTMMRVKIETAVPSEKTALRFNLSPRSRIAFHIPLHCAYRGVYNVGMTTIEVNDVFGLFHIRYDMRRLPYYRQRVLKIFPRLISLPFLPAGSRDAKFSSGTQGRLADSGEAYADLRQHRPGDSLKRVHWKASARRGELMIKNYDLPLETAALIAVDTSAAYEGEDALRYADLACECAAAIAHHSLKAGYTVAVVDADPAHPPVDGGSQKAFSRLYEGLAVLPFGKGGDFCASVRGAARAQPGLRAVYALTPRQDDDLGRVLTELARAGCAVKCILLDPAGESPRPDPARMPGVTLRAITFGEDIARALEETV